MLLGIDMPTATKVYIIEVYTRIYPNSKIEIEDHSTASSFFNSSDCCLNDSNFRSAIKIDTVDLCSLINEVLMISFPKNSKNKKLPSQEDIKNLISICKKIANINIDPTLNDTLLTKAKEFGSAQQLYNLALIYQSKDSSGAERANQLYNYAFDKLSQVQNKFADISPFIFAHCKGLDLDKKKIAYQIMSNSSDVETDENYSKVNLGLSECCKNNNKNKFAVYFLKKAAKSGPLELYFNIAEILSDRNSGIYNSPKAAKYYSKYDEIQTITDNNLCFKIATLFDESFTLTNNEQAKEWYKRSLDVKYRNNIDFSSDMSIENWLKNGGKNADHQTLIAIGKLYERSKDLKPEYFKNLSDIYFLTLNRPSLSSRDKDAVLNKYLVLSNGSAIQQIPFAERKKHFSHILEPKPIEPSNIDFCISNNLSHSLDYIFDNLNEKCQNYTTEESNDNNTAEFLLLFNHFHNNHNKHSTFTSNLEKNFSPFAKLYIEEKINGNALPVKDKTREFVLKLPSTPVTAFWLFENFPYHKDIAQNQYKKCLQNGFNQPIPTLRVSQKHAEALNRIFIPIFQKSIDDMQTIQQFPAISCFYKNHTTFDFHNTTPHLAFNIIKNIDKHLVASIKNINEPDLNIHNIKYLEMVTGCGHHSKDNIPIIKCIFMGYAHANSIPWSYARQQNNTLNE